jgi:AcrR family transcriptional regulator
MPAVDDPTRIRTRRGAHTPRGQQTRNAILVTARRMCSEHWLDQLSLAELARIAGTTRASVLFQFPEGWLDIAADLLSEELSQARTAMLEIHRTEVAPDSRLRLVLRWFLRRGEESGALIPNLRAFNCIWGDVIDAAVAPQRDAVFDDVSSVLRAACSAQPSAPALRGATEVLVYFALDLLSAPMYRRLRPDERAAKLDTAVALVLAGLEHSSPAGQSR